MNIARENIDELNAILKVDIRKADYEEKVEKVLRDYRKKANVKGFRPGMVPIGLIKKMYGKAVQLDEINKIVSESIHKYLADEKLEILGDPLPKSEENDLINFDIQEDFIFSFDLGLAPHFELKMSKKNKVNQYELIVDEKMRNDYIGNCTRRFGEFRTAEKSAGKDVLKGDIKSSDDNNAADMLSADDTSALKIPAKVWKIFIKTNRRYYLRSSKFLPRYTFLTCSFSAS